MDVFSPLKCDLICIAVAFCTMVVLAEGEEVSMVFGGDMDFSRLVRYNHLHRRCSYHKSIRQLQPYLTAGDFAMVNLETTLGEPTTGMNPNTGPALWSEVDILPALKAVGIDYVTVANNHFQDFQGTQSNRTIHYLNEYGIKSSGVVYGKEKYYAKQRPLILEKSGLKIGILSYCDLDPCREKWKNLDVGPAVLKVPNVISEIKSLREKEGCSVVILFLHWGQEYGSITDTGAVGIVKNLTRSVDIDLIVGSHPHVTQKHWYTKKTLVATSLGNLFFTPFNLANYNFNETPPGHGVEKGEDLAYFEKIWYKQMKVMKDGTRHGRLLKVVFNRSGIVPQKSKYIATQIFATKNHCLTVHVDKNSRWQTICDEAEDDDECTGTSTCNYVECDEKEPLPAKLPPSPKTESQTSVKNKNKKFKTADHLR